MNQKPSLSSLLQWAYWEPDSHSTADLVGPEAWRQSVRQQQVKLCLRMLTKCLSVEQQK